MRAAPADRPAHPPLLESLEILIAGLLLLAGWFVWHVARTRYYYTDRQIEEHARFNGVGGFDPNHPSRLIGRVFECAEPCVWQGQNKILFERLLRARERPDYFLVVARPDDIGQVDLTSRWRSDTVLVLSFSECREEQETMLLMPAYSWIRSSLGMFWLEPRPEKPWTAVLRLAPGS